MSTLDFPSQENRWNNDILDSKTRMERVYHTEKKGPATKTANGTYIEIPGDLGSRFV